MAHIYILLYRLYYSTHLCFCCVAPGVAAELTSHSNWAQEFLAREQFQAPSGLAADFDAVTPQMRIGQTPHAGLGYMPGRALAPALGTPLQHWLVCLCQFSWASSIYYTVIRKYICIYK